MSYAVDWLNLPPELLQTIASDLPNIVDYIFFRTVCRSWCASAQIKCCFLPRQFPCIIVPSDTDTDANAYTSSRRRLLFNPLSKNNFYGSALPEFSKMQNLFGSSFGRLILSDGSPDGVIIFNPLNGEKKSLPSLISPAGVINFDSSRPGREYTIQLPDRRKNLISIGVRHLRKYIEKVILAHDCEDNHPNPNKPLAFVVPSLSSNIAYCYHGDTRWRSIDGTGKYKCGAVYLDGKLCLLDSSGSLAICNLNNILPTVDFIEYQGSDIDNTNEHYLVDGKGELLWVQRFCDIGVMDGLRCLKTFKFDILKFDFSLKKWNHIKSLGNKALILGIHSSMALAANDYPGCRGNTIYFTGDYIPDKQLYEVSMFDMHSERVEVLASYRNSDDLIWATPLRV